MIYNIVHTTEYRFHHEVELGWHRLAFRPRDGHDMRVLATNLVVTPLQRQVDLVQDVYGNSVALVLPASPASQLRIESHFTVEHLGSRSFNLPASVEDELIPPAYSNAERLALQPFLLPSFEDPGNQVRAWAEQFVDHVSGAPLARPVISRMTEAMRQGLQYRQREEEGVQTPTHTLAMNSGSCRDYATLMIDALRRLGIAARFVSGYVYSPGGAYDASAGATHAWVQCFLPRCGWFPVDPTNNLIGGHDLIRIAVARQASEVSPLSGEWFGEPAAFAGMHVQVSVTAN
ncbi:MAG: transglutaminase family protein [Chitinophagaceae bacterium]|nr:transglutaminase family protein [Rubrivivax sp.]